MPTVERRVELDGLRGVAILLVFGLHCFNWPQGGHLGVDLFFVLSGFLITTLLLEERASTGHIDLRKFYARRAVRLLPALSLMLAAYVVIQAIHGRDGLGTAALGGLYVGNLVQAFGPTYGPLYHTGLDHLWSLAQEEQFYVVWPLALPFLVRAKRPVRSLGLLTAFLVIYRIVLALSSAPHHRLYNGPDTHMDGLLAGAAAALWLLGRPAWRIPPIWVAIALPVAVDAAFIRVATSGWDAFGLPFAEASIVVLVLAAVTQPKCARALSAAPLLWFGRISYSLYLWHFMLLYGWQGHNVAVAIISIVVAYVSTRWLEEPLRRRHRARSPQLAPALATG